MSLRVVSFQFNGFQENTYLVISPTKNCVIIDPGCYESHEENTLFEYIASNNLRPLALLNTHAHIDHILGNAAVKEKFNIPLYLHRKGFSYAAICKKLCSIIRFPGLQRISLS
jgi:glyoxylase-like metal-dependent hydrolase (beta-lactamase superfamily II)